MPQFIATQLGIANSALRHLAVGRVITTTIFEETEQARAVLAFYDQTRDEVLRDFNWPFARKYAALGLVAGTDALPPNPATGDFQYAYRTPSDCLKTRRILSGSRHETQESRVPFWTGQDTFGELIYADVPPMDATVITPAQPQLEYTVSITNEARFPPDFAQMFSLLLASYIAPALTGGAAVNLGQRAMDMYEWARRRAQDNSSNGQQFDVAVESEFIRSRY